MRPAGLILDFDGVLIESEYVGNKQIADYLSVRGHPTTPEEAMANFMGLSGEDFHKAIGRWIGRVLPDDFHSEREAEDRRVLEEGLEPVAGAIAFVEALPSSLPRAIASSSSSEWIYRHLDHLGLRHHFRGNIVSGREHVLRGKPAPDIYLYAARLLGVSIADVVIVEDSPVGAKGALASGARVIGLVAGRHCPSGHGDKIRALGVKEVAESFEELARLIF